MVFFRVHLITYFLLLSDPSSASITFSLPSITPQNLNRDIIIQGTEVTISDDGIQLTRNMTGPEETPSAGRATYIRPLNLTELASFSTNFTFVIDSNGSTPYGFGLTFFLADNNSVISEGGAMGLPFIEPPNNATSRFVAVEFDTFNDYWDPIVGRGDPLGDHVAIDVSSVSSQKYQKWLSNVTGGAVCQAWIRYDSNLKNLTVSFTGFQNDTIIRQEGLFHTFDLKTVLPESVIFGFSAATGDAFQRNIVRSWSFESTDLVVSKEQPPGPSPDQEPPRVPSPGSFSQDLPPSSSPDSTNKELPPVGLIVGLTVMITFLVALAFVCWRRKSKKKEKKKKTTKKREYVLEEREFDFEMNTEFEMGIWPKQFCYNELAQSTSDFAENNKLGEGGFGRVYKGFLRDSNTYIAVKRVSKSSKQGIEEYASEVRIVSQLRHKNLVQLIGWCHEKGELLLVYDYMENGSLDSHLFKEKSLLTWSTRYKIANGLASALWYLHEGWEQCVLHRDIKSSNVLLDSNFNAKLGDFGLAKLVDHEKDSEAMMLSPEGNQRIRHF
ncbi:hypothetical protein R6Q59_016089 [Mikania micrantha]